MYAFFPYIETGRCLPTSWEDGFESPCGTCAAAVNLGEGKSCDDVCRKNRLASVTVRKPSQPHHNNVFARTYELYDTISTHLLVLCCTKTVIISPLQHTHILVMPLAPGL